MALSQRQRSELHRSVAEYLRARGFTSSWETFTREAEITCDSDTLCPADKELTTLERKWTAVLRLSKRNVDLETKLSELDTKQSAARGRQEPLLPYTDTPLHVLTGHMGGVTRVRFHDVYAVLVSASEDATLRLWDAETGSHLSTARGHTDSVLDLALSPQDPGLLVSCSADTTVKLWSLLSVGGAVDEGGAARLQCTCTRSLRGHDDSVTCVTVTTAGDHVLSSSRDQTVRVWELTSGYCIRRLPVVNTWSRALRAHGELVATCDADHSLRLWNWMTGECRGELRGHQNAVECVIWVCAASHVLSANQTAADGSQRLEASSRASLRSAATNSSATSRRSSCDNGPAAVSIEDLSSTGSTRRVGGGNYRHSIDVTALATPGGETRPHSNGTDNGGQLTTTTSSTASRLASGARDKCVRVWDTVSLQCLIVLEGHESWVRELVMEPCGRFLLSGADDSTVRVWDLAAARCHRVVRVHAHFCCTLHVHQRSALMATGSNDCSVRVWPLR